MARNKVQDALRQRKRSEAEAAMANGPPEEGAYQCFFNRDDLPSPMEGGTLCDFPLAQLSGFPDHEEHFPLYTGDKVIRTAQLVVGWSLRLGTLLFRFY